VIDPHDVLGAVDRHADTIRATMRFVHEHPELGHEEYECSRYLCDTLAGAGLVVEPEVGGMETAFRASLRGERPGETVGLVCL
jgi:metal-dependent amidase/aminoacylase/carboxypeptidase family protein